MLRRLWGLLILISLPTFAAASPVIKTVDLPGALVFPESISTTSDGTLYIGSLAQGGVMRTPPGARQAETWIKPGAFGTRSIFGVLADERSGTLWVCSNDASALGVVGPNDTKGSSLKGFDLVSGEGKTSVPLPGERTLCNDIAVSNDGSVYVTNSLAPQVLRLKPGASVFEIFSQDPLFAPPAKGAGLDGLAFGADGNLYVDKFSNAALLRITISNGIATSVTQLTPSAPIVLADALRPTEGGKAFLMIEGRGRLDRVTVVGNEARIETIEDGFDGPTGVAQIGASAFVSEGQLPVLFGKQGQPRLPFAVRSVPIPTP